jgi:hypothetical protein
MNNLDYTSWILVGSVFFYGCYLYIAKREQYLYKFQEIKDRLLDYAIDGKINTNSLAYKNLELAIDITINHGKAMRFSKFVKVMDNKKLNFANKQLKADIEKQGKEIRDLYGEFSRDFIGLLVFNNIYLLIVIKLLMLFSRQQVAIKALLNRITSQKTRNEIQVINDIAQFDNEHRLVTT